VIELRNRLNKLIEEGKSGYKVYETLEGDYELDHIEEGEIWLRKHPLGSIRRTCMRNEELKNNNIKTIDIRKDSRALIKKNYLKMEVKDDFDIIITNPPFKIARKIIEKALKDVKNGGFVIMLLRLNYFGSQKRFDLWQKQLPKYCFIHHQRMSFTDNGKTDSIEYCHLVWEKGLHPDFTKLKVI